MSLRPVLVAAVVLAFSVVASPTPPAQAQAVGGIDGEGLNFQQAQRRFPGLRRVTFDKADLNGDGVIEPNELPVLQGIYDQMTQSR